MQDALNGSSSGSREAILGEDLLSEGIVHSAHMPVHPSTLQPNLATPV